MNAGGSTNRNTAVRVAIDPRRREVSGMVESGAFCCVAHALPRLLQRALQPAVRDPWNLERPGAASALAKRVGAAGAGGYVTFGGRARSVEARVGLSFVSVGGARANLAESRGRGFAALRAGAHRTWARTLGRVRVSGGRRRDRRVFATSLYHALLEPSVFSDRDGRYRGMDGRVHRARGFVKYADISGWDVYRSQTQLMAMLFPHPRGRRGDLDAGRRPRERLPAALALREPADQRDGRRPGRADARLHVRAGRPRLRRARGAASAGPRRRSPVPHRQRRLHRARGALRVPAAGLHTPRALGGLDRPHLRLPRPALGLHRDHARVRARGLRHLEARPGPRRPPLAARFTRRAGTWRTLVNPASRTIQPRLAAGAFMPGFTPAGEASYVEGSGSQYSWLVPHDPAGLFASMGGPRCGAGAARHLLHGAQRRPGLGVRVPQQRAEPGHAVALRLARPARPHPGRGATGAARAVRPRPGRPRRQRRRRHDGRLVGLRRARDLPGGAGHRRAGARQPALPARDGPPAARHAAHRRRAGRARTPVRPRARARRQGVAQALAALPAVAGGARLRYRLGRSPRAGAARRAWRRRRSAPASRRHRHERPRRGGDRPRR